MCGGAAVAAAAPATIANNNCCFQKLLEKSMQKEKRICSRFSVHCTLTIFTTDTKFTYAGLKHLIATL